MMHAMGGILGGRDVDGCGLGCCGGFVVDGRDVAVFRFLELLDGVGEADLYDEESSISMMSGLSRTWNLLRVVVGWSEGCVVLGRLIGFLGGTKPSRSMRVWDDGV